MILYTTFITLFINPLKLQSQFCELCGMNSLMIFQYMKLKTSFWLVKIFFMLQRYLNPHLKWQIKDFKKLVIIYLLVLIGIIIKQNKVIITSVFINLKTWPIANRLFLWEVAPFYLCCNTRIVCHFYLVTKMIFILKFTWIKMIRLKVIYI